MIMDYTQVASEVLGKMVRVAEQGNSGTASHLQALRAAVTARKQALADALKQHDNDNASKLAVYHELIALEPANYNFHCQAGFTCFLLGIQQESVAYYQEAVAHLTTALQLVDTDPEDMCSGEDYAYRLIIYQFRIWEIYHWRSSAYRDLQQYQLALADALQALRFLYHAPADEKRGWPRKVIYRCLEALGQHDLAAQLFTWAEMDDFEYTFTEDTMTAHKKVIPYKNWKSLDDYIRILGLEV